MITICGIKDCDVALYDEVWYITNYTPNMKVGTFHHKELAPFIHDFLQYKNGNLKSVAVAAELWKCSIRWSLR